MSAPLPTPEEFERAVDALIERGDEITHLFEMGLAAINSARAEKVIANIVLQLCNTLVEAKDADAGYHLIQGAVTEAFARGLEVGMKIAEQRSAKENAK